MGFFKNVFTLGKYGKLENEIKELQKLVEIYEKASPDFTQIIKLQNRVTDLLQEQRKIASKNLYLAKTIVLKVKNRVGDNHKNVLIDEHFLIKAPKVKSKKSIYNTELKSSFDDVGTDFFDLINTSANMLEKKNGNINEKDLIAHGVMIGVGALVSGFEALVDLNDEVREKRHAVQMKKIEITDAITVIQKKYPEINLNARKTIELALVLNKSNQVFKYHYDEILKVIYPKNLLMVFWDEIRSKPLEIPETFDKDINGLLNVCLDYSKLSRNKI